MNGVYVYSAGLLLDQVSHYIQSPESMIHDQADDSARSIARLYFSFR